MICLVYFVLACSMHHLVSCEAHVSAVPPFGPDRDETRQLFLECSATAACVLVSSSHPATPPVV